MKRIFTILASVAVVVIALSSCSVTSKTSFSPSVTNLQLSMADLEYLGEIEVSVEYSKYLGMFNSVKMINGEEYDGVSKNYASLNTSNINGVSNPMLMRAFPKVYETFPKADYFIVTNETFSKDVLILGSENTVTARVKAYRIK